MTTVSPLVQALTAALLPAVLGLLAGRYFRPVRTPMPSLGFKGTRFFLSVWGVAFLAYVIFSAALAAIGVPEHIVSGVGGVVLPAACAAWFVRQRLH